MGDAGDGTSQGLSATAWTAIAAIGAAVITGGVTLLTHFLPASGTGSTSLTGGTAVVSQPAGPAGTPDPHSAAGPRSAVLDSLVGTWTGPMRSGSFTGTMTLTVLPSCSVGQPCGTLQTGIYGCTFDIELGEINGVPQARFATVRLRSGDPSSCVIHPAAGDDFRIGKDQLVYSTGYDGGLSGTLTRVP